MKGRVYRIFGLGILSDTSILELEPQSIGVCESDDLLTVELSDQAKTESPSSLFWYLDQRLENGRRWMARAKNDDGYLLRFHELADFWVDRAGRRVKCSARAACVSEFTLRALLLDHVLPLVLSLRGKYAMHASAVVTQRGSCAFAGDSGIGKSTLATSLSLAGNRILTDDCLILEDRESIFAAPAHPNVKLSGDTLQALIPSATTTMPVAQYTMKRRLPLGSSGLEFSDEANPLARIYFLNRIDNAEPAALPRIEYLSARETFVELVNHAIRMDSTDTELLLKEFRFTDQIARLVPARRLWMPNDLNALSATRELILSDLCQS